MKKKLCSEIAIWQTYVAQRVRDMRGLRRRLNGSRNSTEIPANAVYEMGAHSILNNASVSALSFFYSFFHSFSLCHLAHSAKIIATFIFLTLPLELPRLVVASFPCPAPM